MVDTLEALRKHFASKKKCLIELDFSDVDFVRPEAMLLFYAELTRLVAAYPAKHLACVPARHGTVDQVLQHVGIYELLGHKSDVEPERDDVVPWKVARSKQVEGSEAGELIESLKVMNRGEHSRLYRSVIEAITNVAQHSSVAERLDDLHLPATKEWWMFCREYEDYLYVAVCDLGVGIPRSLPLVHTREVVHAALRKMFGMRRWNDADKIQAALRLRRSRTGESHRGLGFNDILGVLKRIEGSALRIFSNRGSLVFQDGPGLVPKIKRQAFKKSILGTILVWSFPISGIGHEH